MSPVQISKRLPRTRVRRQLETNVRLVEADGGRLPVERVQLESADRCPDLRQKVCSRLRGDGRAATPSPWHDREIVVSPAQGTLRASADGDGWHARLAKTDDAWLDLSVPTEAAVAADLLQKALVVYFEQSGRYWWLSESTRYWYDDRGVTREDDVALVPRISLATCHVGVGRLGVVFDGGSLLHTAENVAELLQSGSRRRFDQLRGKQDERRGTLIYDTGKPRRTKCYFNDYVDDTCGSSGVIAFGQERYDSLYDYYRERHPSLSVSADDAIVSVSFEWGKRPVLVAAKLLHLRLKLDPQQLPPRLRRMSLPPGERKQRVQGWWTPDAEARVAQTGGRLHHGLWRPSSDESEQLSPPTLLFGGGKTVGPPKATTLREYQRYYRHRERMLREYGAYRFEPTASRDIWVIVPPLGGDWTQQVQDAFIESLQNDLSHITKTPLRLRIVAARSARAVSEILADKTPASCLVVFDKRELDGAAYYLLSQELRDWRLKRIGRRTIERAWRGRHDPRDNKQGKRAERAWNDIAFHTVLDLLDQVGTIPWRVANAPYDACLAVDVSESKRYCGLSMLLCRDPKAYSGCDGFWRYLDVWNKTDTRRETINAVRLEDKVATVVDAFPGARFSLMSSVLVLRDGRECSDEPAAIRRGLERWMRRGVLSQSADIHLVDYHKRTVKELRMWNVAGQDTENVLEGRAVYLGDSALVCPTGAASLGSGATAEPCLLVAREGADVRRAAAAVFTFAQHNYLSPGRAYRDAQPMRDIDHELKRRMAMEVRLR